RIVILLFYKAEDGIRDFHVTGFRRVLFRSIEAGAKLYGRAGNDILFGRGGDDYIDGGDDSDFATGVAGDDLIFGGAGADWLDGRSEERRVGKEVRSRSRQCK